MTVRNSCYLKYSVGNVFRNCFVRCYLEEEFRGPKRTKDFKYLFMVNLLKVVHDNLSDYYVFAEMLMQRPIERETLLLPMALTKADVIYMQNMAAQQMDRIMAALKSMPRSLLLVFRYQCMAQHV